jgi:hypothetical protein
VQPSGPHPRVDLHHVARVGQFGDEALGPLCRLKRHAALPTRARERCANRRQPWLDDDHLAWFVIDAVAELDLEPFYASYRADSYGRAAHDPQMMVTLFADAKVNSR